MCLCSLFALTPEHEIPVTDFIAVKHRWKGSMVDVGLDNCCLCEVCQVSEALRLVEIFLNNMWRNVCERKMIIFIPYGRQHRTQNLQVTVLSWKSEHNELLFHTGVWNAVIVLTKATPVSWNQIVVTDCLQFLIPELSFRNLFCLLMVFKDIND